MAENKITFDVLAAWNDLARAILRDGELSAKLISGGTIQWRDLELLESARLCDDCGAVYVSDDWACPVCKVALNTELLEAVEIGEDTLETLEDALTSIQDAISDIKEINFKIDSNTR